MTQTLPIIFCSDPLDSSRPHFMWEQEVKIASNLGNVHLLDFQALMAGNVTKALRKIPENNNADIMYHGWMMTPASYEIFYTGLSEKGYTLITSPKEYLGCHHISNWYPIIQNYTPKTKIVPWDNLKEVLNVVKDFGESAIIIKDFVSSQKHAWKEACFIPSGKDLVTATKVIETFIAKQQEVDGIQGGLVLREFVPLKMIGSHPKSGMPLSQEFRAFIFKGKIISVSKYWEDGNYTDDIPPISFIKKLASKIYKEIGSKFFTIDIAQKINGDWICIEVGDGQVSSLPEDGHKKEFYSYLMNGK